MCIMAMYTTKCTRFFRTNNLVLLGMATLLVVVSVRLVPLGFTRFITLITLVTLVTLVTLLLIIFLQILGIGCTLLRKHLTLGGGGY